MTRTRSFLAPTIPLASADLSQATGLGRLLPSEKRTVVDRRRAGALE